MIARIKASLDAIRIRYGWIEDWWNGKLTVLPLIAVAIGYRGGNGRGITLLWDGRGADHLFWNAALFIRIGTAFLFHYPIGIAFAWIAIVLGGWHAWYLLGMPFVLFVGVQIRWRGAPWHWPAWLGGKEAPQYFQTYIGPKCNNDEVALFPRVRFQSDASAAKGTSVPNTDQASGWEFGPK